MKAGIIGYGRLGKLISKYLSQDFDLYIFDKNQETTSTLQDVLNLPVIILCVPISEFEKVVKEISTTINPEALIIDTCSVKERPIDIMKTFLPPTVSILGTHPMFGPDSANDTLYGAKIVLCKERIEDKIYKNIIAYLNNHGLNIIEATAEEHDQEISSSLALTHFIGRALIDMKASPLNIETKGYRRLLKIYETVQNDSWQLFQDMNNFNKYSQSTRKSFIDSINKINQKLNNREDK
ncbi:MAG: prephenate dehydrogenase [Bdellovibrionales bacterium]|jgi:prephenate dehydrogenase|nr:prephenate dehydrogenase [Bdellovibrionales bacterium]